MAFVHKTPKKKNQNYLDENPFESIAELGTGVTTSLKKDLAKDGFADILKQLSGKSEKGSHAASGDLHEGQEIDLRSHDSAHAEQAPKPKRADAAPGLDYVRDILHGSERHAMRENHEIQQAVAQIMDEINRLIETSEVLQAEFGGAAELKPVEVGKYHINFFEWMLTVIKEARLKIEDSGAWLSAMGGKKDKRNYWAMFKKHGTTFGMSNERSVATQTG